MPGGCRRSCTESGRRPPVKDLWRRTPSHADISENFANTATRRPASRVAGPAFANSGNDRSREYQSEEEFVYSPDLPANEETGVRHRRSCGAYVWKGLGHR